MNGVIDLVEQRFGRLTVVTRGESHRRVGANGKKRADTVWRCRCDCGVELDVFASDLRRGRRQSCTPACMSDMDRRPWPRAPRYLVGEDGSIVGPHGRVLKQLMHRNGYFQVAVPAPGKRQGRESVHVIVCETFHGPRPDGHEVAHENGIPSDCRASNLSWKTCADNHADKERHGTLLYSEAHPNAKLTEDRVRAIRAAAAAGESQRSIGARYGIHQTHVGLIIRRKIWRRVA